MSLYQKIYALVLMTNQSISEYSSYDSSSCEPHAFSNVEHGNLDSIVINGAVFHVQSDVYLDGSTSLETSMALLSSFDEDPVEWDDYGEVMQVCYLMECFLC